MDNTADSADQLRVLVVDADDRVRASLARLLVIGRRCVVVGAAGTVDEAVALAAGLRPEVVLIDPRLPAIDDGRRLIARLRDLEPAVRVLVMGSPDAVDPAVLGNGVDAVVRKTYRPKELVDAVLATRPRRPFDVVEDSPC